MTWYRLERTVVRRGFHFRSGVVTLSDFVDFVRYVIGAGASIHGSVRGSQLRALVTWPQGHVQQVILHDGDWVIFDDEADLFMAFSDDEIHECFDRVTTEVNGER